MRGSTVDPAQLDRMFFALADVHRRDMLALLSAGPASVSELAGPLQMALPSAVKHLAVLEQGGFVASHKTGRVRTYQVEPKAFKAMDAWVARHKRQLEIRSLASPGQRAGALPARLGLPPRPPE